MGEPRPQASEGAAASGGSLQDKTEDLRGLLCSLGAVLVAFSGGVDSATLLYAAQETLGRESVLAVTACGDVHTEEESDVARTAAMRMGVRHLMLETHELAIPGFAENPPERCYLCKRALYERLVEIAEHNHLETVVDGSNADDLQDYRPGTRAIEELGVRSPLAEVGLTKAEVRALARGWGLAEWDRPSSPCLASRFPYGARITTEVLRMVEEAERYVRGWGFSDVRVRHHGDVARIETAPEDIARVVEAASTRRAIVEHLRGLGYTYVTLDLQGFRSGSLNEALSLGAAPREEP